MWWTRCTFTSCFLVLKGMDWELANNFQVQPCCYWKQCEASLAFRSTIRGVRAAKWEHIWTFEDGTNKYFVPFCRGGAGMVSRPHCCPYNYCLPLTIFRINIKILFNACSENLVLLTLWSPEGWQTTVYPRLIFSSHPPGLKVWKGTALIAGARLLANPASHLKPYVGNQVFRSTKLGCGYRAFADMLVTLLKILTSVAHSKLPECSEIIWVTLRHELRGSHPM